MPDSTPHALYGPLFVDVQMQRVLDDGKTFADALPRQLAPAVLRALYESERQRPGFSLPAFVHEHFMLAWPALPMARQSGIREHIRALWPLLVREHREPGPAGDSLLPLPQPYVVPGGRFRELYYWDSYFTMLGLLADGQRQLAEQMLADFVHLIDTLGFIPNSSRRYMLSRSQPPFFFKMVELLHAADPADGFARYLPQLRAEHGFWMAGADGLAPGQCQRRVVRLADGALLNRYWDDQDGPREESWREDVLTARRSARPAAEVWRDLRAAAESGWDFSSRWYGGEGGARDFAHIATTRILPVDLNALLAGLEAAIAAGAARQGDAATAADFAARAEVRRELLRQRFWNDAAGHFVDLDLRTPERKTRPLTAAALAPLFMGIATAAQAEATAAVVERSLLGANGLLTTPADEAPSGQQWDAPNGWAPLQWMAVEGLCRYGHEALARRIAERWCASVHRVYLETGRMMEKYDVSQDRPGGGGEYETQDGFGWTNGVYVALREGLLRS